MNNRTGGFTLVELLIVIVVIAILAAISVVAYNGIQGRAHDTIVRSDLTNMAKKVQLDQIDRGYYIKGGTAQGSPDSTVLPGLSFAPAKNSYWTTTATNLFYCEGQQGGIPAFRIIARSKSGKVFRYDSLNGISDLGVTGLNSSVACQGFDAGYSWSYGYNSDPVYGWFAWTNG